MFAVLNPELELGVLVTRVRKGPTVGIRCFDGSMAIPIHLWRECGCLLVNKFPVVSTSVPQSTQHAH